MTLQAIKSLQPGDVFAYQIPGMPIKLGKVSYLKLDPNRPRQFILSCRTGHEFTDYYLFNHTTQAWLK